VQLQTDPAVIAELLDRTGSSRLAVEAGGARIMVAGDADIADGKGAVTSHFPRNAREISIVGQPDAMMTAVIDIRALQLKPRSDLVANVRAAG